MIKIKFLLAATVGLVAAALIATTPALATSNGDASSNKEVFRLVADTATKICGEVPDSGWSVDASANTNIDASLNEFFKKLVNARATGNAEISGSKYAGPLRSQLMEVRRDTQDCTKVVANQLIQYVRQTQQIENVPKSKRAPTGGMGGAPNDVHYPKQSAQEFANRFVQLIDRGNYSQAYQSLDPSRRAMQSREAFVKTLQVVGSQCYPARSRAEMLSQDRMIPASQSIFKRNEYIYSFKTRFKNEDSSTGTDSDEVVGIVLSDSGLWHVIEFISTCFMRHNSSLQ